ncbi:MAG: type IX secretion system membrane protein PorP/SprF [Prevotellaceae bacterium]|jgi:type IX secretion system PorP/SprF family membrane protein|nr:type IX secretion system membrane protein PorP/SprF [Prevotellaceae bacterium]
MKKHITNTYCMYKRVLIFLLILCPFASNGQTDMQLSQQLFNRVYYNPASAGASQYINGILLARQQWTGFSKAPRQIVFSADGYLPKIKSGLGISALVDKLGIEQSTNVNFSYSYHIRLSPKTNLSFGLSVGILHRSVDKNAAIFTDPTDPNVGAFLQDDSKTNPDFNFGVELNHENFAFGAAVTHLSNSSTDRKDLVSGRHFYLYGRYKIELTSDWDLVPSLSAQNNIKDFQLEVNAMTFYKKRFWAGASYRVNDKFESESVVGMLGLYITDFLRVGYAYDLNVGDIGSYSSGSHEIMLGFRIKPKVRNSNKTPRLFLEY